MIGAVNYMYYARSCPPLELIRRQPNQRQSGAIQRLRLFVRACDHGQLIEVAASGGKNLQLMARLQELASAAEALGISQSPYVEDIRPQKVCPDNTVHPQLSPFSNLKPERLKLTGTGGWDTSRYLEPELYMAFQEPQFIEIDRPIFNRGIPNFEVDSPDAVFELLKKWDGLGLLALHPVEQ